MASIFTTIEGLTVTKEDILEAETFAEQWLSAQFPTYDFRQGTALRDMTVRPNATLLAMINKAIIQYFDETDVSNITNSTDKTAVEDRLSNFFLTRQTGDSAVVKTRLYFSFPTSTPITTTIPSTATFSTDDETSYSPVASVTVNPPVDVEDPSLFYFKYDAAEQLWYVDVDMTSSGQSLDANKEEGDLLYFTIFSPYFLRGNILYLISAAVEAETNEEMVNRSYTSISTRNLINTPSIISKITDQFNYAEAVFPVGLGDPSLYRDLISLADPVSGDIFEHHRGGMTDVYVKTPTSTVTQLFTLDANLKFTVQGPVINLSQSIDAGDATVPPGAEFSYVSSNVSRYSASSVPITPADDIGISADSVVEVTVPNGSPGETINMDVQVFSGIGSINDAINGKSQRVVCADYLTRSYEPVFVDVNIVVRTGDETLYTPAQEAIAAYISSIPAGGVLYVSEVIAAVQGAGVTDFEMPLTVDTERQHKFLEYDSTDPLVVDTTKVPVTDNLPILETQVYYPRTILVGEGVN